MGKMSQQWNNNNNSLVLGRFKILKEIAKCGRNSELKYPKYFIARDIESDYPTYCIVIVLNEEDKINAESIYYIPSDCYEIVLDCLNGKIKCLEHILIKEDLKLAWLDLRNYTNYYLSK
jgi:hypothetical protein